MMGPYYCYEAPPIIDDIPQDLHIHDCMWSGECYSCQPTRITFSNADLSGTVPITVGGTSGYITLTATAHQEQSNTSIETSPDCSLDESSKPETVAPPSVVSSKKAPNQRPPNSHPTKRASNGSTSTGSGKKASSGSVTDTKKLRHREVEKNRHRQLQAMVKTLSEKIPGRLDKETQVQTMKRAARYCVYLRDVMNLLTHGQPLTMLKEELAKIYDQSYENVELIMSQHIS